jgi:hypothetical protein
MTGPELPPQPRMLLFIGNPTEFTEVARWAMFRDWAIRHDFTPTRTLTESVVCAVAPTRVLQHHCPTADSVLLRQARDRGIPCVSVIDDPNKIDDLIGGAPPTELLERRRSADRPE